VIVVSYDLVKVDSLLRAVERGPRYIHVSRRLVFWQPKKLCNMEFSTHLVISSWDLDAVRIDLLRNWGSKPSQESLHRGREKRGAAVSA
jgi:hypothetical protein